MDQGPDPKSPMAEAAAWNVIAYLLAGLILYGGIGALLDRWLHTWFLLPIGIVGGVALALYWIYVRYGKQ